MSGSGGVTAGKVLAGIGLLVLRVAFAGLFVWAAWIKLQDPRAFYFSIKGFQILPVHTIEPLAFMVPWTEMACAVALVLGLWGRAAAAALGAMLLGFIGAILSVLVRDMHVECGCFGDFSLMCPPGAVGWCNIGQNALMLLLALPVIIWGPGLLSLDALAGDRARRGCCGGSCRAEGACRALDSESASS